MQRKNYTAQRKYPDASRLKVGVVVSQFNSDITEGMLQGALETLAECKVKETNITVVRVPGSFEVPLGCLRLIQKNKCQAVVALGCIIKGETSHDVYIANAVSQGLMNLSLGTGVPISFGIITTNNLKQAVARSRGEANKGKEAVLAALQMALGN